MIEASVMRTVWNDGKTGYEVKAKGHAGAGKYGQRRLRGQALWRWVLWRTARAGCAWR